MGSLSQVVRADATYWCMEKAEMVNGVVEYRTYCPPTTSAPSTTTTSPATTTTLVTPTTTAPAPAPSTTTTVAPVVSPRTVDREDDAKVATAVVAKPGLTG